MGKPCKPKPRPRPRAWPAEQVDAMVEWAMEHQTIEPLADAYLATLGVIGMEQLPARSALWEGNGVTRAQFLDAAFLIRDKICDRILKRLEQEPAEVTAQNAPAP